MTPDLFRLGVQTVVSLGLLASGVFVLVGVDGSVNRELHLAAAGWIGGVLTYWLK